MKNFGAGVSKQISFLKGGDGTEFRVTTRKMQRLDTDAIDSQGSFLEKYMVDEDEHGNPISKAGRQQTPKRIAKLGEALDTFSKFKDTVRKRY